MKIKKKKIDALYFGYPNTVSIILAKADEKLNIMAAAWHMPVSMKPPLYCVSISPKRYTYGLMKNEGEWTINFLPYEDIKISVIAGRTSGKDIDKLQKYQIETEPALVITTPVLKSAYASMECKLYDTFLAGDHEIFVGEVVAIHYEKEYFTEDYVLRPEKIQPLLYIGADHYITVNPEKKIFMDINTLVNIQ